MNFRGGSFKRNTRSNISKREWRVIQFQNWRNGRSPYNIFHTKENENFTTFDHFVTFFPSPTPFFMNDRGKPHKMSRNHRFPFFLFPKVKRSERGLFSPAGFSFLYLYLFRHFFFCSFRHFADRDRFEASLEVEKYGWRLPSRLFRIITIRSTLSFYLYMSNKKLKLNFL